MCLTEGGRHLILKKDISQTPDNRVSGKKELLLCGGQVMGKEGEEEEAKCGERGVKNVRRAEENRGEKNSIYF